MWLDGLRNQGDATFDPLVEDLARGHDLRALSAALAGYARNDDPVPAAMPRALHRQLVASARVPLWASAARLDRAAAFFGANCVTMSFLLGTTSLLECFVAGDGVQALHATKRMLRAEVSPRIGRTGGFVLQVMARGAFTPTGSAVPALLRVRLQHALARHYIAARGWDASLGVPICQEDQLGTLMAFAFSPMLKLRMLGALVSRDDVEDALHLWRVAGELLGTRGEWIPRTEPEALALVEAISARQFRPTPEGIELAESLIESHCRQLPVAARVPFLAAVRHLVGERIYEALQLPSVPRRSWGLEATALRAVGQALLSSRTMGVACSGIGIVALKMQARRMAAAA